MPLHADLCTILQNASRARLRSIPLASTKDNLSILSILLQHGFIHNVVRGTQTGPSPTSYTAASPAARRLWVDLKFRPDDRPVLEKMNVVSKPSRKLTMDKDELLRLATGRRAKFVKPLDMGEIGIVDCGKNGWWEVRDAIRRGPPSAWPLHTASLDTPRFLLDIEHLGSAVLVQFRSPIHHHRIMFGLGSAFYLILFITNALAVLSEDRFLARVGWSSNSLANAHSFDQGFSQAGPYAQNDVTVKARLINLISAVRTLMRIPLVAINIVVVIYLIILG
ncbi:ribosomal protein S8 [Moesziomyces antarcticus]|uniref:Ribosomal protein S8 n=1 Tax=Pseudozyma antarctica TaxID=84753 RepID=A0A081CHR1_PSEA2|nr:ribosomal protein S8 [Moesziomyces antarcticus]GAK66207.1 ribosomal protein S8 [Moesziomyces antarcticus]